MLTPFSSFRETYGQEQKRSDARSKEDYKEIIMENIGYEILLRKLPYDEEPLDEITELIADTVRSTKTTFRIPGDDKPAEAVTSRFLKLIGEHSLYALFVLLNSCSIQVLNGELPDNAETEDRVYRMTYNAICAQMKNTESENVSGK